MNFDLKSVGAKARGLLKTTVDGAFKAAVEFREHADRAAEVVAEKCSRLT